MLTPQDQTILTLLDQNLTTADTATDLVTVLATNEALLKQLGMLNTAEFTVAEKTLVDGITLKFQRLVANIDRQQRQAQAHIMQTKNKKSTVAAYMQYDPQATFVNRDL